MNIQKLLNIYEDQCKNLEELLSVAGNKQRAVINNQLEFIDKFTLSEELSLSKINRKEIERENCVEKIFSQLPDFDFNFGSPDFNQLLVELKKHVEDSQFEHLTSLRNKIKTITLKVSEVNAQNKVLIEQANNIVKQTLQILLKSQNKPILDKRV